MINKSTPADVMRIEPFFANGSASGRRRRSVAGLLLALVLLPVLLGVLACLPVPVGDPEKSRIDPGLSGVWRVTDADADQMLMVLDPYDKRTWLMTLINLGTIKGGDTADVSGNTQETPPQAAFSADTADGFEVEGLSIYKCWLTVIKGVTFITWESKTLSGTLPDMVPEAWWVFRVRKGDGGVFYLDGFDYTVDGLNKVKTRKEAEKIIRKHVGDPGFFDEEDALRLDRMTEDDFADLPRLLEDFGLRDNT